MGLPARAEPEELADAVGELERRIRRRKLLYYRPYPKQYEFHRAGARFRERLLMAGNQEGKTFSGGMEAAMHLTGKYPDWWPGRRYDRPVLLWTGAVTDEASRELIQHGLLGTETADKKNPDFGTGSIPYEDIVSITTRQSHVKGVVNEIYVKHVSGGQSRCVLKTYAQGAPKWQGKKVDIIWLDEEPTGDNADVYSQALTRTMAAEGGMLYMTRTPEEGKTPIIRAFTDPDPEMTPKSLTRMSIYDCIGGKLEDPVLQEVWGGDEWTGHYTAEEVHDKIMSWPAYERKCRTYGEPMAGEGLVFTVDDDEIKCSPFDIPNHYARICGVDFGWDHPAAAVWLAHDRHQDIVYLYDCYRKDHETAVYHASAIKKRDPDDFIPVAWPHDGLNKKPGGGKPVKDQYREEGVRMMKNSARYEDEKGGSLDPEPVIMDILERMKTGRFKVFSNLGDWFEEKRSYHRKDGKIVDVLDDLMAATRYAMMELRHARVHIAPVPRKPRYNRPVVGGRL